MKILAVTKTDARLLPLAERCKTSWDYWHPDIPMHIVNSDDWRPYLDEIHQSTRYGVPPMVIGLFYAYQKMMVENYDLLIYIDADTVVTGRCEEMIIGDYDIAVSHCYKDDTNYFNAGVWASKDLDFIKDFYYSHNIPEEDNNLFMQVFNFYKTRCNIKILDNKDSGVWYNQCSREWWNRLKVIDNKLYTPDRQIKILHWAGGNGQPLNDRMSCSLFSDEVKQWLNKITNGTTFTDHDGVKFGNFMKDYYRLEEV